MKCLEFKRLALSDPNSDDISFIKHSDNCPDCLKYVGGIRVMDNQLAGSIEVLMPDSLSARLELNQILQEDRNFPRMTIKRYAKVASIALAMFAGGFLMHDRLEQPTNPVANEALGLSQGVIVNMIEHMEANPMLPVWDSVHANRTIQSLLSVYDSSVKLKQMARLQFTKICPMGEKLKALHANLDTDHGQITFAYVKGESAAGISDNSYKGYMTRVKPIRGGNLLIISRNMYAMEDADKELESALYWDI